MRAENIHLVAAVNQRRDSNHSLAINEVVHHLLAADIRGLSLSDAHLEAI